MSHNLSAIANRLRKQAVALNEEADRIEQFMERSKIARRRTPTERSEIARKAVATRNANR